MSSIRSKQTGHVGNSTRSGVGGGKGFRLLNVVALDRTGDVECEVVGLFGGRSVGDSNVMLLTNTT